MALAMKASVAELASATAPCCGQNAMWDRRVRTQPTHKLMVDFSAKSTFRAPRNVPTITTPEIENFTNSGQGRYMNINEIRPAFWMEDIYYQIKNRPLNRLLMPGSHDSGTFSINANSPVSYYAANGIKDAIKYLPEILGIPREFVVELIANLARSQASSITDQLHNGVRVFDFRVQRGNGDNDQNYYVAHSLVGGHVLPYLQDIATFLHEHPKEIATIQLSHFEGMDSNINPPPYHVEFLAKIKEIFSGLIASRATFYASSIVEDFISANARALIVYGDASIIAQRGVNDYDWLWSMENTTNDPKFPFGDFYGSYADTMDLQTLKDTLSPQVKGRNMSLGQFFWLSGQFTFEPDLEHFKHFYQDGASLLSFAKKTNPAVLSWIQDDWNNDSLNIIGLDYVDVVPDKDLRALDICNLLNTEPSGDWVFNTKNIGDAPKCTSMYFNTIALTVPPGKRIIGFQLVHTSYAAGYRVDNQIAPVLTVANPDGSDRQTITDYACQSSVKGDRIYANGQTLICPSGKIVTGFQLVETNGNNKYRINNQLAPALTVAWPDGTEEHVISAFNGEEAIGVKDLHMDTQPLAQPIGSAPNVQMRGFRLATSSYPDFETNNRLLGQVLFGRAR